MKKRMGLTAAALVALSFAIVGFASLPDRAAECPEVSSTCTEKANYLYLECNLFLYDPDSGEPLDIEDLIAQCEADTNEWIKAIMDCIALFCPDGCAKVEECVDEVTGDDDDDTDDDNDDDADDDDTDDDDWLNDDEADDDGDDDSDDLWDDDDEGDDDTTAPTPEPKSDDDDEDDPYAWCA